MKNITIEIHDDKTMLIVPVPVVEGENLTTQIVVTAPPSWDGYLMRCLMTTPRSKMVDPFDVTSSINLTNSMLDGPGTLKIEFIGTKNGVEVVRTREAVSIPVYAARKPLGNISPEPLPDFVAEMLAAKTACEVAKDGAILATETVSAAIPAATAQAQADAEAQVDLAEEQADSARNSATLAANNILNGITTHNADITAHPSIIADIRTVEAIARGRATAYVFDTLTALNAWIAIPENAAQLVVGDNLYIRALNVKDRWWDGTQVQMLESEAPDLTNYYLKSQVDAMMPIIIGQAAYDALVAAGTVDAGRIYYVTGA